ncbi:hypothetical protein F5887DRAFT_1214975 [Amanita rubescens]|nr:hypothetical protein F5887DRAFT_1214975 [Amanita rubescens]
MRGIAAFGCFSGQSDASLIIGYQGNEFKLRTLYDIVGWIFSVVGDVPNGATAENYYYALMMIGYVFCTKLIYATTSQHKGQPPRDVLSKASDIWSVMWFEQMVNNELVTRVVLGANLDKPGKIQKHDAKDFRKRLLKNGGMLVWDDEGAPAQRAVCRAQDFGHCAETYPLLFIFSLAKDQPEAVEIRRSATGFTARASSLYKASELDIIPYKDEAGKMWICHEFTTLVRATVNKDKKALAPGAAIGSDFRSDFNGQCIEFPSVWKTLSFYRLTNNTGDSASPNRLDLRCCSMMMGIEEYGETFTSSQDLASARPDSESKRVSVYSRVIL